MKKKYTIEVTAETLVLLPIMAGVGAAASFPFASPVGAAGMEVLRRLPLDILFNTLMELEEAFAATKGQIDAGDELDSRVDEAISKNLNILDDVKERSNRDPLEDM